MTQTDDDRHSPERGLNGLSVADSLKLIELTTAAARVASADHRNRELAETLLRRVALQIETLDALPVPPQN